ncbi:MAG: C45 family autoproteolytic acyltransferase/hydrolase [Methanomicrobiales archaeon]
MVNYNLISIIVIAFVVIVVGVIIQAPTSPAETVSPSGKVVATYGEGKLYQYGPLYLVELNGDYREMGRQYGALRNDTLHDIYNKMSSDPNFFNILNSSGIQVNNYEELNSILKQTYASYPKYDEIIMGISETTGLGNNTYLTCSIIKELYYMESNQSSNSQCSFAAAWGPYTTDSSLVAGRNYDLSTNMANYTEIVVYNPNDGSIPVANLGYTGSIYFTSGVNSDGLFIELNSGTTPDQWLKIRDIYRNTSRPTPNNSADTNLELFQLLQNSSNMNELETNFNNASTSVGTIINAADKEQAYSFEWMPYTYRVRPPQHNGFMAATNLYIDPAWGLFHPVQGSLFDAGKSIVRIDNLLNLGQKNKGKITPEIMMQMMSTPIPNGGPLFPNYTSYEMVVVPSDLKVWFKVPQYYNWTGVDLKKHFR